MKRMLITLCILLGLCTFATAEEIDPAAVELMLSHHPGWKILVGDQCGNTAAAALAQGDGRILCVTEKYDGRWVLTIDNPTALLPGQTPSLLMDTDIALFWSYEDTTVDWPVQTRFSSFKRDGEWDTVSCTLAETNGEGMIIETSYCWRDDGVMWRLMNRCDWNDNMLSQRRSACVPARWLAPYMPLGTYDVNIVPRPNLNYTGSWMRPQELARAAEELLPGYTFLNGSVDDAGLELFMRRPDGSQVLVGVTSQGVTGDWCIVESTPLPADAFYGYENFSDYLYIDHHLVSVQPFADGSWGIDCIWPETAEDTIVHMGQNWVGASTRALDQRTIGNHPWSDLTAIDWDTLPRTLQSAAGCVDPADWAVVNNPDPADRLHLRERADKSSASLGKYYNGTPVEVLKQGETWTQVRILGVEGWMMTRYLAFDGAALNVTPAMPDYMPRDSWPEPLVYQQPRINSANQALPDGSQVIIIGILGDEWYHVWFSNTNHGGYMKQEDFWAGNG